MTRFASARPAARTTAFAVGGLAAMAILAVLAALIALIGLGQFSSTIEPARVPGWLWYYRQDPEVRRWLTIGLSSSALTGGVLGAAVLLARRRPLHGAARWASGSEQRHAGLRARRGIVLGRTEGGFLIADGPEHVMLYAPTRTGKGVGVVIPILGVAALSAPYAIKSRFAVAAAHLSHQANMAKDLENWKDEFPDKNLYLNDVEPFGRTWGTFRRFKLKVEPIAGSGFKAQTHDFRNAYNHRFSPRLLLGLSNTVTRYVDGATGVVSYGVGGTPPLDLNKVADVLQLECNHCYVAFEAFQALVGEQVEAITKFETKNASKTKAV